MAAPQKALLELAIASGAADELIRRELEAAGLEASLFALLNHIGRREPVAPSVIASEEGIPITTIRDNVQRLIDRGLVRRTPNPRDGRSYLLSRTARGDRFIRSADAVMTGVYRALVETLPRPLDEYDARLRELQTALREVLKAPQGFASRTVRNRSRR